jgi:hypothetical protein
VADKRGKLGGWEVRKFGRPEVRKNGGVSKNSIAKVPWPSSLLNFLTPEANE